MHAARGAGGAGHVVAHSNTAAAPIVGDVVVGRRQQTGHVADSVGRRGAAALAATVVPLGAVGRTGALGGRQNEHTPLHHEVGGGRTDGRRVGRREAPRGVTVPRRLGGEVGRPGGQGRRLARGGASADDGAVHGRATVLGPRPVGERVLREHAVAEAVARAATKVAVHLGKGEGGGRQQALPG